MERVHLFISGRVQGVWYRGSAVELARTLGLVGWVRNRRDGRVEAVAEGDRAALAALVSWANDGPPSAQVEDVEVQWLEAEGGMHSFEQVPTV